MLSLHDSKRVGYSQRLTAEVSQDTTNDLSKSILTSTEKKDLVQSFIKQVTEQSFMMVIIVLEIGLHDQKRLVTKVTKTSHRH